MTEEIAEARGVPVGETVTSPAAHSAFSTPIEMLEWLTQLREMSGGKPVGIKLCVGQPHEIMAIGKAMLETGLHPDFITVDGAEGGTGAAPLELSNSVGMPLREGQIWIRNMLVGTGFKDRVKIAAAGKIHSGAQMAKSFAIGADWCNAARPSCSRWDACNRWNAIRAARPALPRWPGAARTGGGGQGPRVARFQRQTLHSLREITVAMGLQSPWEIAPRDMRERVNGARSDAIDHIYSFIEPGALVDEPDATPIGHHWRAARADSFRRAS